MIGNKCFLDTSVIIHFFKNDNPIVQLLKSFEDIYVSTIVVGELYYGAYASSNLLKHVNQIQVFLSNCIIIPPDISASIVYGQIKADLKRKGSLIPENDIWIASIAVDLKLPLFTTDKHFELIKMDLISV